MSQLKKGDVVILKSGGPLMTIEEIGSYSEEFGPSEGASCVWFQKTERCSAVFDLATLTIADQSGHKSISRG